MSLNSYQTRRSRSPEDSSLPNDSRERLIQSTAETGSECSSEPSTHTAVFMCFVWIWEQTAIISLYIINWQVCITDGACFLRGMAWLFTYNSKFCPHSVFTCFVWIWEQKAIISLYSINWLVCITDGVCLLRGTDWLFIYNSTFCPHSCVYVFCVDLRTNSNYFPIQH